MLSNAQIMRYLQREDTISRLEEVLEDTIDSFTQLNVAEYEVDDENQSERPLISTQEEVDDLLMHITPQIYEITQIEPKKERKAILFGNSNLSFLHKYLIKSPEKSCFYSMIAGTTIGAYSGDPTMGALIFAAIYGLESVERIRQTRNVYGITFAGQPSQHKFYVREQPRSELVCTIAHEITHTIHLGDESKIMSSLKRIGGRYLFEAEGIAEVVADQTIARLDPTEWKWEKASRHTTSACNFDRVYQELCAQQDIPLSKRRAPLSSDPNYKCDAYAYGHSAIELMRREAGNLVIPQILRGETFDI